MMLRFVWYDNAPARVLAPDVKSGQVWRGPIRGRIEYTDTSE